MPFFVDGACIVIEGRGELHTVRPVLICSVLLVILLLFLIGDLKVERLVLRLFNCKRVIVFRCTYYLKILLSSVITSVKSFQCPCEQSSFRIVRLASHLRREKPRIRILVNRGFALLEHHEAALRVPGRHLIVVIRSYRLDINFPVISRRDQGGYRLAEADTCLLTCLWLAYLSDRDRSRFSCSLPWRRL